MTTTTCPVCQANPPAGKFCGICGAALAPRRGDGPAWLRLRTYAAAPEEHVLRLAIVSSLFPRLPRRARAAFRTALVALAVLLAGCAALRWQGPLIGICALGLPLLFVVYLVESDAFVDMPIRNLLITTVLGVGLGVGWAVFTGPIVARTYDDVLGSPLTVAERWETLVVIPLGAACGMLLPAVIIRLLRPRAREALDGFVVGALAALCFTAAGTLTRLAPQFQSGLVADDRPVGDFLVTAAIQGVAVPLTAAAVIGKIGATLWFTARTDTDRRRRWTVFTAVAPAIVVGLLAYLALGWIDDFWLPEGVEAGVYVLVALLAVVVLRIVLQATLLHEKPDPIEADMPVLCPQCDRFVPDLAFCPSCGTAAHAASRSSRLSRRASRTPAWPVRHTSRGRLLLIFGAALALVVAATVTVSVRLTPPTANYVCPPDCGRPPLGQPVTSNPRFASTDGQFSVSYPAPGSAYVPSYEPNGVSLDLQAGDGGTLHLFGEPANGRTPQNITEDVLRQTYPDATTAYQIPNAQVGYQLGYGLVADVYPDDTSGDYARLRVLVMAAVKNDYALIAAAAGPYHEFSPSYGSGHPSGANFMLAMDMAKYVNSFTWRDDAPR